MSKMENTNKRRQETECDFNIGPLSRHSYTSLVRLNNSHDVVALVHYRMVIPKFNQCQINLEINT